jgi:hypothetical protein
MDSAPRAPGEQERREHERLRYYVPGGVEVGVHHPGGSFTTYRVQPRDLGRGGLGFLHGNFVHPGASCIVKVTTRDGGDVAVSGKIVSCQHISGKTHQVGVRFDAPLDPDDFLARPDDVEPGQKPAAGATNDESQGRDQIFRIIRELKGLFGHSAVLMEELGVRLNEMDSGD